jgi:hypothetical protein
MARKEVNVFGASFLDLLSGALGAVIILYIIVPKLTITVEEYEEQVKLAEEVQALGLSIDALSSLIPQEELEALHAQMERIQQARAELERELSSMQQALQQCLAESAQCQAQIQQLQQQVQQLEAQLAQTQQQLAQTQQQLAQSEAELSRCESELAGCPDTVEEIEGDQRFIIVNLDWRSQYHDIDLHVIDPAGNEFKYNRRTFSNAPGELTVDNLCGPGFEVWQVISPRPGRYQLYANFYSRSGGRCETGQTGPSTSPITMSVFHRNGIRNFNKTLTRTGADAKELIATVIVDSDGAVTFQ